MTMQVALRAKGGAIVFASDTKVMTVEEEHSNRPYRTAGMVTHPKIVISKRHNIAVALAGSGKQESDATQELADHLSAEEQIHGREFQFAA
jgi:hypothetical protein